MWPAEGAVGESVIGHFRRHGVRWIATDQGVLQRSGKWGYEAHRPEVLCRAWRAGSDEPAGCVSIFFRDAELSNAIGFRYGQMDPKEAAAEFVRQLRQRFLPAVGAERLVPVILDGENAWGSYQQAGRPFFDALYGLLGADPEIGTVTFSEFLAGDRRRGVGAHPLAEQPRVYDLAHASWIDECGSRPGNDLGTWIGEPEENAAWDLLRQARETFQRAGVRPETFPEAFEALYAAEGSDWFWWYGDDQTCEAEPIFDDLFRHHLRCAYRLAGLKPRDDLEEHLVPHAVTWTFQDQPKSIGQGDRLRFKAGCPGVLVWSVDGWRSAQETALRPSGGVMAGLNVYAMTFPPFGPSVRGVEFFLKCGCAPACRCAPEDPCCDRRRYRVFIQPSPKDKGEARKKAGGS